MTERDTVSALEYAAMRPVRVTIDPDVCGGQPTIRGLRIRVQDVLDLLAAGASHAEILADYPYVEAADITAAIEFADTRTADHRPNE